MAKSKGKPENLHPCKDTETAKARGKQGGIKSGEAKREKILMSNILADYLMEEHEIIIRDDQGNEIDRSKISAKQLIKKTITGIMRREDSASASMIKTLGELTEGKNVKLSGENGGPVEISVIKRVIVDSKV